jgi:hypothetical protein
LLVELADGAGPSVLVVQSVLEVYRVVPEVCSHQSWRASDSIAAGFAVVGDSEEVFNQRSIMLPNDDTRFGNLPPASSNVPRAQPSGRICRLGRLSGMAGERVVPLPRCNRLPLLPPWTRARDLSRIGLVLSLVSTLPTAHVHDTVLYSTAFVAILLAPEPGHRTTLAGESHEELHQSPVGLERLPSPSAAYRTLHQKRPTHLSTVPVIFM